MSRRIPIWLDEFRDRLPELLSSLSAGRPGVYRLCTDGDLWKPGSESGLGLSCYAAKLAVQCNFWEHFSIESRREWIRRIQRFQIPPGKRDHGLFADLWIERRGILRYAIGQYRKRRMPRIRDYQRLMRWAETRQSIATLAAAGAEPLYPLAMGAFLPENLPNFLGSLSWDKPWEAGAQIAHLLFFLKHSSGDEMVRVESLTAVMRFLRSIEQPSTGGWYKGDVSNADIVNGAMKVLSGLHWWDCTVQYPAALARTATAEFDDRSDCAVTNRLFVLNRIRSFIQVLPGNAHELAWLALNRLSAFIQADGRFAASRGGSLRFYYFTKVSKGKPVGDLHGLILLTWAITLALQILDLDEQLGWRSLPA